MLHEPEPHSTGARRVGGIAHASSSHSNDTVPEVEWPCRSRFRDGLSLVVLRVLVSGCIWLSGFRAISDDDFARVVIAQRFAGSPSLDPSGSSWLPFPFWLQGSALWAFEPNLETAQVVAVVSGVVATLLIWVSAHLAGLNRWQAWLSAALATVFPYAARLGVATVPELLSAALTVLGATSLSNPRLKWRVAGAGALMLATLSRYETWPVAAAFSLWNVMDARSTKRTAWLAPAGLASLGMLLWLLHGQWHHHSPLFFVKRVADYQAALHGAQQSFWGALLHHPLLLLRHEPELSLAGLASLLVLWTLGPRSALERLKRPLVLIGVLLAFLISSDLRGAGATHHPERALLAIWIFAALLTTAALPSAWRAIAGASRILGAAKVRTPWRRVARAAGVIAALGSTRWVIGAPVHFVDRHDEVTLGRAARAVAGDGELLIMTRDYGYFAIMAGFADPSRAAPFDTRDPRTARLADPFAHPQEFRAQLRKANVQALIVPKEKLLQAKSLGNVRHSDDDYVLLQVGTATP